MSDSSIQGGAYGIKETADVVKMAAAVVRAAEAALADGTLGVEDIIHLVPALGTFGPAIDGIALVPKEIGELDDADKQTIKDVINAEFGSGKYELIGEDLFIGAVHLAAAIHKLRNA